MLRKHVSPAIAAAILATFLTSSALASTGGPLVRLTSRGNELARTTGLRRGDLPTTFRGVLAIGRPGVPACGGRRPTDDRLRVDGYATATFSEPRARVASKVTVYRSAAMTDTLFAKVRSSFTAACAVAAAGAAGQVRSAEALHVSVPLAHARGFSFVLRRNGIDWTGRVYILGEGRIASTLLVEQRGTRFTGGTAALTLSLLVSRMED